VSFRKSARLLHRGDGAEAPRLDETAGHIDAVADPTSQSPQAVPIRALLIGNNCTAAGLTASGSAPVLGLCRVLLAAGHDPDKPLLAFRGQTLALIVRSIREGARLAVEDDRHGRPRFRRWRDRGCGAGALIAQQAGGPS
jgi:hypothetical protein